MQITLNGEVMTLPALTLAQLLQQRGWSGKRLAVERNGAIVPKSQHASTVLTAGDRLEIVIAVGGG
ncbi:MAG: sulfur carrier protein ThiS [Burkholderiales bacterium]